jgi:hypothetical protein
MNANLEAIFGTYNTRRNLPSHTGRRRAESNFLGAFLKSFMAQARKDCWYGRNFAIPGCGVADCIIVEPGISTEHFSDVRLLAFEAKLADWRQALKQAYRYRYYADAAIVVLPLAASRVALCNRDMFRQLGVSLWTFNEDSRTITSRIAVKLPSPLNSRKRMEALLRIRRHAVQFSQLLKEIKALG